jgi:hypothetical protein
VPDANDVPISPVTSDLYPRAKMRKDLDDPIILARKNTPSSWHANAPDHAAIHGGIAA